MAVLFIYFQIDLVLSPLSSVLQQELHSMPVLPAGEWWLATIFKEQTLVLSHI